MVTTLLAAACTIWMNGYPTNDFILPTTTEVVVDEDEYIEYVLNGHLVGTGVRGTWTASTSLNKAYSDMIEALQIAKETICKYQKIEQILDDYDLEAWEVLEKIKEAIKE